MSSETLAFNGADVFSVDIVDVVVWLKIYDITTSQIKLACIFFDL